MPAHSCSKRPDLDRRLRLWVQDGYTDRFDPATGAHLERKPVMVPIRTKWLDIPCGHDGRATDPDCAHCERASK